MSSDGIYILEAFWNLFLSISLQELVPCVLLSFDDEQILMWRGSDWKPKYLNASLPSNPADDVATDLDGSGMQ